MYNRTRLYPLLILWFTLACKTPHHTVQIPTFDTQGHRGARGLMPENTIPAMVRALDLGVTTLEMDVVISKDKQVVVSHDPYFSAEISTRPDGSTFTAAEQLRYNLYAMDYTEIRRWDVGLKPVARFPQQQKMAVHKPLLTELIDSAENHARVSKRSLPFYNIETKSDLRAEAGGYQPDPETFTDLLMAVVNASGITQRTIIQSLDERTLQVMHRRYPQVSTAYLIEGTEKNTIEQNITKLGFTPSIYSPEHTLVTPEMVKYCREHKIRLIPWTVNTKARIDELKAMGVDGIISDYPNLF